MEKINKILDRWTNAEEIRLRAGEIDPDTMRTVLAVVNGMAREVRAEFIELNAYADKLAAGLPEGMLPKDIENLREANARMADEIENLMVEIEDLSTGC